MWDRYAFGWRGKRRSNNNMVWVTEKGWLRRKGMLDEEVKSVTNYALSALAEEAI